MNCDKEARVLIAGGCGFIGHRVASQLKELGVEVLIVDNKTDYGEFDPLLHQSNHVARSKLIEGCMIHQFSILDHERLVTVMESFKPTVVIQLASVPIASVAAKQPMQTSQEMTVGAVSLLEASRLFSVKRYVYVSSSMTYGDFQYNEIKESHPQNPKELYGALKLAGELIVATYAKFSRFEHVIVRPIAVYGPTGNEAFVLTRFVRAARGGGIMRILGAETRLDFTFVTDAANGIVRAAMVPEAAGEVFNISSGQSHSLLDAAKILKRLAPSSTIEIGPPDPLYPKRGSLSIEKARMVLGYEPAYNLDRGLEEFYAAI